MTEKPASPHPIGLGNRAEAIRALARPWKTQVCSIPFCSRSLCAGTHNRVEYIMPCTFRRYVLPTSIERRLAITRTNVMRSHTLGLSRSFPLSTWPAFRTPLGLPSSSPLCSLLPYSLCLYLSLSISLSLSLSLSLPLSLFMHTDAELHMNAHRVTIN